MNAMVNLAILTKSCHRVDDLGRFHNCDKFDEISSNYQTYVNQLNTKKPAMMTDLTILTNFVKLPNLYKLAKHVEASHVDR